LALACVLPSSHGASLPCSRNGKYYTSDFSCSSFEYRCHVTEVREKHDKPDDPNYAGGEDENRGSHKPSTEKTQKPKNFPVDENDCDPATAPDDRGEG
jgi:hypothetical protein